MFYDKHGRVVPINQKESPEAYREYQRAYQRIWRKKNPHYYRDLKRKKSQEYEDMKKTMKQEVEELKNEITRLQNVIADLEMKMCSQNDVTSISYESLHVPSIQACSEEELMKFTEHK